MTQTLTSHYIFIHLFIHWYFILFYALQWLFLCLHLPAGNSLIICLLAVIILFSKHSMCMNELMLEGIFKAVNKCTEVWISSSLQPQKCKKRNREAFEGSRNLVTIKIGEEKTEWGTYSYLQGVQRVLEVPCCPGSRYRHEAWGDTALRLSEWTNTPNTNMQFADLLCSWHSLYSCKT